MTREDVRSMAYLLAERNGPDWKKSSLDGRNPPWDDSGRCTLYGIHASGTEQTGGKDC